MKKDLVIEYYADDPARTKIIISNEKTAKVIKDFSSIKFKLCTKTGSLSFLSYERDEK